MAGYSGTPLVKKLGIKPNMRLLFVNAPSNFGDTLGPLPDGVKFVTAAEPVDFVLAFVLSRDSLAGQFGPLSARLVPNGMLWVAWPKQASKVATDLNENIVREIGLLAGLVDVKIVAIDETWSGLKFVFRLQDRPTLK